MSAISSIVELEPFLSAAAGGFFGAMSAFGFETWKSSRADRIRKYQALFDAQFVLMSQHNYILNVRNEYLNPCRNIDNRFTQLSQFMMAPTNMRIDFGSISFVAQEDDPNILNDLHLAELAYENVQNLIPLRNDLYQTLLNDNQEAVEEFDFETGRVRFSAPLHEAYRIKQVTDQLYSITDDANDRYLKAVEAHHDLIKRLFPKKKAMKYASVNGE